ncbi:MAG: hypothetical protein U0271_24570 [Polyangiaceae bacterium]
MAIRLERTETRFTLFQSRTGLRVAAVVVLVSLVAGWALLILMSRATMHTKVDCDHALGGCTVQKGQRTFAAAPIDGVEVLPAYPSNTPPTRRNQAHIVLHRASSPVYLDICNTEGAAATTTREHGEALRAFLDDPKSPPLSFECDAKVLNTSGVSIPAVFVAPLGGLAILFLLFFRFAIEIRTTIDKSQRTVRVQRRWFIAWTVKEYALDDVLDARAFIRGVGRYRHIDVVLVFRDAEEILWSPAATLPHLVRERLAALRTFLGKPTSLDEAKIEVSR